MFNFKSVDDLLDFINNFDGCGLIITDDDQLRNHLTEAVNSLNGTETTGDHLAFALKFKDKLAPGTISDWITRAEMESVAPKKIACAQRQLKIVTDFQTRHPDQCQIPD